MSYYDDIYRKKFIDIEKIPELIKGIKADNKKVSFTNGCFDLLHPGHLDLLYYCRKLADLLIIGLNTDESIKALKGDNRPVLKLEHRSQMLAGYSFVDYITSFSDETPIKLIELIRPDFLIKGTDWGYGRIVGEDYVQSYEGKVIAYPLLGDYSSSKIIDSILDKF